MGLNNPVSAITERQTVLQNGATSAGNGTILTLDALSREIHLTVGGGTGTVEFEVSFDGGASWVSAFAQQLASGAFSLLSTVTVVLGNARFLWRVPPGAARFRSRVVTRLTGNITVSAVEKRG